MRPNPVGSALSADQNEAPSHPHRTIALTMRPSDPIGPNAGDPGHGAYPPWSEIRESFWLRGQSMPMLALDTPTFMRCPHAVAVDDLDGADVVIIGSPYVTSWTDEYAGVPKAQWSAGPKRVRQQSAMYASGYIQDFDIDVLDQLRVVDFGNAEVPPEAEFSQAVDVVLAAQAAVEEKVGQALGAGALPIVIGQNSPAATYAVARSFATQTAGAVGLVSLDTHWDASLIDRHTMDPRVAGSGSWLHKTIEFLPNIDPRNVVEIGPRGMHEMASVIRDLLAQGVTFYSGWHVRQRGIEEICAGLDPAYNEVSGIYLHIDMDVLGGNGGAPSDILGDLAEPLGLRDYDILRIAHEVGRRGVGAASFVCIPPGSALMYRLVVYAIMYLLAGRVAAAKG